jgi:protein tyrosine/serine phosphatase
VTARVLFASLLMLLAGAATAARPDTWAAPMTFDSLPNLHRVTPTIYRSAQPRKGAQEALDELGIRTVISLRWSADDEDLLPRAKRVHAPIESWDVDHDEILRALRALIDPDNHPVLLHCRHGADRTGTVIATYRIVVEGWPLDDAIREMREGGYNYHSIWTNMVRYLRGIDVARMRAELGLDAPAPAD